MAQEKRQPRARSAAKKTTTNNSTTTPDLRSVSRLTDGDVYLFREGTHAKLYEKLGAHAAKLNGRAGTVFGVWAPNAESVSVVGDFNAWDATSAPMTARPDGSGIWEAFVEGVGAGSAYKYHIVSRHEHYTVDKTDPFAFETECPPLTASIVADLSYTWNDAEWRTAQAKKDANAGPMSVYEMHLGSWRRDPNDPERFLSYREIAMPLVEYIREMGFTHVEFLPVMEHPYYPSWGYQTTGYFAPTRRYGTPREFMFLVDTLHQNGIGVILDWVPSHFPTDEHGLGYFDGTHLFEHADARQGFHPDWKSAVFNYGRDEVRAFLTSSALFWMDTYHADGIRVDAVASMLYLDYSRKEGEWIPNRHGGRENTEAVEFLRGLNTAVYREYPGAVTIAEESTSWPMVSRPVDTGGLGFGMKWNMGWMHDTLEYFRVDPIHRRYAHEGLSFSICYAFSENFVLPLSHDEVVHGKGTLFDIMPGDSWQKAANLRLMYGYMFTHPGKKLLFMGDEFGQKREWNHDMSLDWHLREHGNEAPLHGGLARWVRDLNTFYRGETALHETDFDGRGFAWIDFHDAENCVLSYLRRDAGGSRVLAVVANFTPVPRYNYRVGVVEGGFWKEVLNSDATLYGGSGHGNVGGIEASPASFYGRLDHSLSVTLPPLGLVVFSSESGD